MLEHLKDKDAKFRFDELFLKLMRDINVALVKSERGAGYLITEIEYLLPNDGFQLKSGGCYLAGYFDDNKDKIFIIVGRQKRIDYYIQMSSRYGFDVESVCYPWDYDGKDRHYLDNV